jgi:hypothetical protein
VFIAGTSLGNILVLQPIGESDLNVTTLQRTQLSLKGFFQTIDRLIRGSTDNQISRRPIHQMLLARLQGDDSFDANGLVCAGETVSVWSRWQSATGTESCKDVDLLGTLTRHLEESGVSYANRVKILDTVIVSDASTTSFTLISLCAVSETLLGHAHAHAAESIGSLYVFGTIVDISAKLPTCEIAGKLLVDHNCALCSNHASVAAGRPQQEGSGNAIWVHWFTLSEHAVATHGSMRAAIGKAELRVATFDVKDIPGVDVANTQRFRGNNAAFIQSLISSGSLPLPPPAPLNDHSQAFTPGVLMTPLSMSKPTARSVEAIVLESVRCIGKVNRIDGLCALMEGIS